MKGLLIKDIKLIKTRGIFILFVVAAYAVLQLGAGNSEMSVGLTTLILSIFSITSITYDEYDNGMPFLFTLPITRREYVREKYVFGFALATITWVVMSIICFSFEYFVWTESVNALPEKLAFTVAYLLVVYFMVAFEIAMKLKFAERSGLAAMIIMAVMGALIVLVYSTFDLGAKLIDTKFLEVKLFIGMAVVFAAMIYGFYRWSVRIMEMREL
ncbi:ABC-2 transporter permease [Lachnospiraceae bacterium MD335]|nr:ABC-2 transporter permease [Lachnospiraceae bacterium MD335]